MYGTLFNEENLGHSFNSYDEAITFIIAFKYDGINTRANEYFMKALMNKK